MIPTLFLLFSGMPDAQIQAKAEIAYQAGLENRHHIEKARPYFLQAAEYYAELVRQGAYNPEIQLNLGNAYYLSGDIPRAILSYHQGLKIDPANSALQMALDGVRSRVFYPGGSNFGRPVMPGRSGLLPRIHLGWLSAGGFLLFSLTCIALTRWLIVGKLQNLTITLILGALVTAITIGFCGQWQQDIWERTHPLVVISQDGVLLRKGNSQNFPPRYETPLHIGVEAHLQQVRGQWLQIELSSGETGWIPTHLGLIETDLL